MSLPSLHFFYILLHRISDICRTIENEANNPRSRGKNEKNTLKILFEKLGAAARISLNEENNDQNHPSDIGQHDVNIDKYQW